MDYPWLADDPVLHRQFLPDNLDVTTPPLKGIVFVQADCLDTQAAAEVAWVRDLAHRGAPIVGIVAHAALERGADCAEELAVRAADDLVVGIRRLLQDMPAGFALRPEFVAGVRLLAAHGLVLDLCVRHHQLPEVADLVQRCPEVTFVLDHLGKPDVAGRQHEPWASNIARLAASGNVSCKLSGLGSEADADTRDANSIRPYLQHAVDVFGPGRCMFGSDWPVVTMSMDYRRWLDLVVDACSDLTAVEKRQIMSRTTHAVYGRMTRPRRAML